MASCRCVYVHAHVCTFWQRRRSESDLSGCVAQCVKGKKEIAGLGNQWDEEFGAVLSLFCGSGACYQ